MDNIFQLDDSARKLYGQFAGIDGSDRAGQNVTSGLLEFLNQEEKVLDYYRLLLAQATCLFSEILINSSFASLREENNQKIKLFVEFLKRIAKAPKFDGKINCRLRGQQCPSQKIGSETYDYELSFGNFLLDYQVAQAIEQREGKKGAAIYTKLMDAFKAMSVMEIFNFSIDYGSGEDEDYRKIEHTIDHLVHYYAKKNTKDWFVVHDEYGQPNVNLTMLAATNNVKSAALQNLVNKIKPMMLNSDPTSELSRFTTVYDVILASKSYRKQLKKMPIEVNNVQWLTQSLEDKPEQKAKAVKISRLVLAEYGSNPRMASEVMSSINSDGYTDIRTDLMGKRLSLASKFINLAEQGDQQEELPAEALKNIELGLENLSDDVFDNISIENNEVSSVNEKGQQTSWSLHDKILGLLSFFKQRSTTKKKVRDITNKDVKFGSEDYSVIARNFKITELEASHLIDLLRGCFDHNGRFRRAYFEKNIPQFIQYESKVFEFLWHYLKELSTRHDRVSFLNALQILVARLTRPQDALHILLKDIFGRTPTVNYSDRNGLILATILLRNKNREERSNVELTPEEVLLVRKGLIAERVGEVVAFLERNNENVIQKVRKITQELFAASAREDLRKEEMQAHFLLYLLRELVIFLALVGNESGRAIICGLIKELGNPESSYYTGMKDKGNIRHSLLLLQVASRALQRFNDPQSDELLDEITRREEQFVNLFSHPSHLGNVERVMAKIRNRSW
ncbi:MAG: hypothetical protein P1P81_08405 [Desulfobulbales bacterium]|nr:hypothetical protein [Desulfobulbales bacterium]